MCRERRAQGNGEDHGQVLSPIEAIADRICASGLDAGWKGNPGWDLSRAGRTVKEGLTEWRTEWIQTSTLISGASNSSDVLVMVLWAGWAQLCGFHSIGVAANCSSGCISWDLSWGQNVQDDPHPPGPLFQVVSQYSSRLSCCWFAREVL